MVDNKGIPFLIAEIESVLRPILLTDAFLYIMTMKIESVATTAKEYFKTGSNFNVRGFLGQV
jgi:hypothetical protein